MLILIPTYNRISMLRWVLKSVAQNNPCREKVKVVVVNNHPPSKEVVERILEEFKDNENIEWVLLNRETSMTHVKNWYSAIDAKAAEDEAVLMLGDDDIMLQWGMHERFEAIVNSNADMLLTNYVDRLYYYKDSNSYWLSCSFPQYSPSPAQACEWSFAPGEHPEASFISNHTYRYTQKFKEGLRLAFQWCEHQSWLEERERMGMLPLYLPYAISLVGGKVVSLDKACVIRGAIVPDVYKEEYAGGGSTGLLLLCAYDTFSNKSIEHYSQRLEVVANFYKRHAKVFDPTMFMLKNISLKSLHRLYKNAGIRYLSLINMDSVVSIALFIAKKMLRLSGFRLKLAEKQNKTANISLLFNQFQTE